MNTSACVAVAAVAGLLAACGAGSPPSADSLLRATFASHRQISSGRVELSLALTPHASAGAAADGRPSGLHLAGAFQGASAGQVPSFAMTVSSTSAGDTRVSAAVSSGGRLYLSLAGQTFLAPATAMTALQQGFSQGRAGSAPGGGLPGLATLGMQPGGWLNHPSLAGRARIAGVETIHLVAGLDRARFLADAGRVLSSGEALAGGVAGSARAQAPPPSASVRSARVDLYTGAHDHLLRRLAITAQLSGGTAARAAGLKPAQRTLTFELSFAQLNQPQIISVPASPRPPSALARALERLAASGARPPG
jgi:hypothetical protein